MLTNNLPVTEAQARKLSAARSFMTGLDMELPRAVADDKLQDWKEAAHRIIDLISVNQA